MLLPFVSVVMPVRNRRALLEKCLQSIREMDYPQDRLEVIVADADSEDGSAELAESMGATVIPNPAKDLCTGRNLAFAACSGEIVAFCDSDSVVPKDWIRSALKYLQDPAIAGVGGPEMTPNEGVVPQSIHCCFTLPSYVSVHSHSGRAGAVRRVPHVPTCNFVCRREALSKVMPLSWTKGCGSDLHLGRMLREQGYALLRAPDVRMWHHKRSTWQAFMSQLYAYGKGRAHLVKTGSPLGWTHGIAAFSVPAALMLAAAASVLPQVTGWLETAALLSFLGCMGYAFALTRRISVAICTPLLLAAGTACWSAGFLRVWLTPAPALALPSPETSAS